MGHDGLLIGEVAARSGVSRRAVRLYEAAGILPAPARTAAGYRVYRREAAALLGFVAQAQRLGFTLAEIRGIAAIRRLGGTPCRHVRALVRRKAAELDRTLDELAVMRRRLRGLLRSVGRRRSSTAVVCSCIETTVNETKGGNRQGGQHGRREGVAVPGV